MQKVNRSLFGCRLDNGLEAKCMFANAAVSKEGGSKDVTLPSDAQPHIWQIDFKTWIKSNSWQPMVKKISIRKNLLIHFMLILNQNSVILLKSFIIVWDFIHIWVVREPGWGFSLNEQWLAISPSHTDIDHWISEQSWNSLQMIMAESDNSNFTLSGIAYFRGLQGAHQSTLSLAWQGKGATGWNYSKVVIRGEGEECHAHLNAQAVPEPCCISCTVDWDLSKSTRVVLKLLS